MATPADSLPRGAFKTLHILELLMTNFANGVTPGEVAKTCDLSASSATRYLQAMEEQGFVERIPETGRMRGSHRIARLGMAALNSLNAARYRADESVARINPTR